jgi:tetratricopeptide (TPR) repeat protein
MSRNVPFLYLRAMRLINKGDYHRGIDVCKEILDAGENSAEPFYWISYSYKSLDDIDNAVIYAEKALWRDPNHFHALLLLSSIYESKNDYEKAYEYVCRALANPPAPPQPPPKWFDRLMKMFLVIAGRRSMENELKENYIMEREDREWLNWAKEFKEWYEKGHQGPAR